MKTKTLLNRIDTTIDGIRYKTVPNANIICSSDGKMYSYTKQSTLIPFNLKEICKYNKNSNGYGYLQGVYNDINGNKIQTSKHRIIAYAFGLIDDIHQKLDVDHINKITDDNRLENLRAITHKKNLETRDLGKAVKGIKKSELLNTDQLELYFDSLLDAAKYIVDSHYTTCKSPYDVRPLICNALKKKVKSAYGFIWEYVD